MKRSTFILHSIAILVLSVILFFSYAIQVNNNGGSHLLIFLSSIFFAIWWIWATWKRSHDANKRWGAAIFFGCLFATFLIPMSGFVALCVIPSEKTKTDN